MSCTKLLILRLWPGLALLLILPFTNAVVAQGTPPLHKINKDGFKLEMQALPLETAQAFLIARGFAPAQASFAVNRGCFFRSSLGNSSTQADARDIHIDLRKWRIVQGASERPLELREAWQKIWRERNLGEAPATAFYWALYPTTQSYGPNDYNWGFLSFGLPPGSGFDLKVSRRAGDDEKVMVLKGLICGK